MSICIEELSSKIVHLWQQYGFESPGLRIRMVLEEALLNAWKHGNRKDPDKSISVGWRFGNDFHLSVMDEGCGFDYDSLPDPVSDENLTRESGRGLFIIRHFADSVRWKHGGRQIIISFRKHARAAATENQTGRLLHLWECPERSDPR